MDNQHTKIKGYRDLSQEEIDLMNEIKEQGQKLAALQTKVHEHLLSHYENVGQWEDGPAKVAEYQRLLAADPYHWLGAAKLSLQTGLMMLTRVVAQPTTF